MDKLLIDSSRIRTLHRIHFLDGVRACAALMVMTFHFIGRHGEPHSIVQAAVIGQTGVDLFFVLSGFLITRILLLSKNSPHYFKTFYARRTLRIFPLYYLFLIIYFYIIPWLSGTPTSPLRNQAWSWFYLENLPATFSNLKSSGPIHFWSLAVEEHFYGIWPLLIYFSSRANFVKIVYATLALPLAFRVLLLSQGISAAYFTLTRFDALGYGALLALMLTGGSTNRPPPKTFFRLLLAALLILLLPSFTILSGSHLDWLQVAKLSLIPAFYFAFIGFCVVDPLAEPLRKLLSLRWLRSLGAVSYGLYVFHLTCFSVIEDRFHPSSSLSAGFLSFGLTAIVAYLSFYFFESPFMKLKRRFHYEINENSGTSE